MPTSPVSLEPRTGQRVDPARRETWVGPDCVGIAAARLADTKGYFGRAYTECHLRSAEETTTMLIVLADAASIGASRLGRCLAGR